MCSTCNFKNFEKVTVSGTDKLQNNLGTGKMVLRCDMSGHNWKLGVTDNDRDEFVTYSCPTCGKALR